MRNQAIFQNHQQAIAQFLHQANSSIHIAMCWFSNPLLFSILLKKANAGVRILLIVQFDQANFNAKGLPFHQLIEAGAEVQVFHHQQLLHHKFAIRDGKILLTGSYNWTRTQHADNVLILENLDLAQKYLKEFHQLWATTEPLALHSTKKPPAPAFHQLFQPILWNSYDLRHAIIMGATVWLSVFQEKEMPLWQTCLKMQRHFLKTESNFFEENRGVWDTLTFSNWVTALRTSRRNLLRNYCIKLQLNDVLISASADGKLLGAGLVGSVPQPSHLPQYGFARYVQWFEFSEKTEPLRNVPKRCFGKFRESGLRLVSYLEE